MNAFELIPNDTRSLLQAQPGHKVYRAMARAATGYKLPDDCQTYTDIVAWYTAKEVPVTPKHVIRPQNNTRISVPVEGSYRELGRCDYATTYAYDSVGITAQTLADLINDSGSLEDFIEAFREYVQDETPYDAEAGDTDYSYSDHEAQDRDSEHLSFDVPSLVERLRQFAIAQGINPGVLAVEGDEQEDDDEGNDEGN